mmetsp:Transcript_11042/g.26096  ORF Transcript_11042/g.26096 Transcript_11042/m.26096 type:complete len:283 (+) Transcript_11042:2-850(+)
MASAVSPEVTLAVPPGAPPAPAAGDPSQRLQRALAERERGAPKEQIRSAAARLRKTRSCGFMHSSMEEPMASYKALEPLRPRCTSTFRRFHLTEGFRVLDQDTIVVSARDSLQKTKTGLLRSSSGTVTYSHRHKLKLELDVEVLAKILGDGVPGGGYMWTLIKLERIFKERTGRPGCWADYDVGLKALLALCPKTFELFGPSGEFVQLRRKVPTVLDDMEEALIRLARARETGILEPYVVADGASPDKANGLILPELVTNRFKAVYSAHRGQSMSYSSSRGA